MKYIKTLVLLLLGTWCFGQNTQINNDGFESGSSSVVDCNYFTINSINDFNSDVDFWNATNEKGESAPTWFDVTNNGCVARLGLNMPGFSEAYATFNRLPAEANLPSDHTVMINEYRVTNLVGQDVHKDMATYVGLPNSLTPGATYTLRIKYVPMHVRSNQFNVHLTEWGPNWHKVNGQDNMYNVLEEFQWLDSRGSIGGNLTHWRIVQTDITINLHDDELHYLVIESENGAIQVDDVQMWLKCDPDMTVQDELYDDHFFPLNEWTHESPIVTESSNRIETGGTVVVEPLARHQFTAANDIFLNPGFHAQSGSEFLAVLGPCNGTGNSWSERRWVTSDQKSGYQFDNFKNATSMVEDPSTGNIYTVSTTDDGSDQGILLTCSDKEGNILNSVMLGDSDVNEEAHGLLLDYDHASVVVVGAVEKDGEAGTDWNLMALKHSLDFDAPNPVAWSWDWGVEGKDERAYTLVYDDAELKSYQILGDIEIGGEKRMNMTSLTDFGTSVQVDWYKYYDDGSTGYDQQASSLIKKVDGTGFVVAGLKSIGATHQVFTLELDGSGTAGGTGYQEHHYSKPVTFPAIKQLFSGKYTLVTTTNNGTYHSILATRFDDQMTAEWTNDYQLNGMDDHYGVSLLEATGGAVVIGAHHTKTGASKVATISVDDLGDLVTAKGYAANVTQLELQSMNHTSKGYALKAWNSGKSGYTLFNLDHNFDANCGQDETVTITPVSVESPSAYDLMDQTLDYTETDYPLSYVPFLPDRTDACGAVPATPFATSQRENPSYGIKVFPNPANSWVIIQQDESLPSSIELLDVAGKVLFHTTANTKQYRMDMTNYSEGIYIIKLSNSKGVFSQRMLME